MRLAIMLGKVQHLFSGATDMAIKARPHNPQGDESKEALLERAKALNEEAKQALANTRERTEGALPLEEAQRIFDRAIEEARASQLKWMEEFGPPPGWVRVEDQVDGSAVESHTDSKPRAGKEAPMSDALTRPELDAKLEAIEARMDGRIALVSEKIDGFLAGQSERDKRYELLAERVTKAAEGAEEAAKQAATVKSNYWAAVGVQLLAVVAILVGAYFANQANVLGAMQTTISAMQAGKEQVQPPPSAPQQ